MDLDGNGFNLTSAQRGVNFDLDRDGTRERLSWTAPGGDDAWLVLDRNSNSRIDNGGEMFGNYTPQPPSPEPNGFLALAEFDKAANGGNGNGVIDAQDRVFALLRLWRDADHNGVSSERELLSLTAAGVRALDLDYSSTRWVDRYGNQFRFRARVRPSRESDVARWAYDVFLVRGQ